MENILKNSFLLSGIDEKTFAELMQRHPPRTVNYHRGDLVYRGDDEIESMGFVITGRLEIRRPQSDNSKIVINLLYPGETFGILSVFSGEEFPTEIYASINSTIAYYSKAQILEFVNNYSQISTNIITFLADRVLFLNKKIAAYSATSVESKLAIFIINESIKQGSNLLAFNAKKTAEELSSGRASIYRALSSLQNEGLIIFTNKRIEITDRIGLERKTK